VPKAFLPQKRRRSREIALQMLYSLDIRRSDDVASAVECFPSENEDEDVFMYAVRLVRGTFEKRMEIDGLIREHLTGWRPERMVAVDRVAVRLALFEGVIGRLTPIPVAISEAVELVKAFGTEESGRFVNGVLGKIVRALPSAGSPEAHEAGDVSDSDG
jgi:N utilization substance protein B